jgi:hypothetical protein
MIDTKRDLNSANCLNPVLFCKCNPFHKIALRDLF